MDGFYLFGPHDIRVEGEDGVLSNGLSPPVGYAFFDGYSGRGYALFEYGVSDTVSAFFADKYYLIIHIFRQYINVCISAARVIY